MNNGRLLDTGIRSAAENMALDEAILEARGRGLVPDTLRFLQFSPAAVLVGYHQTVDQEVRMDFCARNGIDVNRRLTGGGAIFCDETQLGWEVIAGTGTGRFPKDRASLFGYVAGAVVAGLKSMGVDAAFRPRNDIEVAGRKISGTGAAEGEGAFLFQGTLLLDFDVDTMLRALRIPVEKLSHSEVRSLRERVTWLRREMGFLPRLDFVKAALASGFESVLGLRFEAGGLHPEEERLFRLKRPFFESKEWLDQVLVPRTDEVLRSVHTAAGGVLRVALIVDTERNRVKSAVISGDFFAFPQRGILDLEAALKDAPADCCAVEEIVEAFFQTTATNLPGVSASDFRQALRGALERADYRRWDIGPAEASTVFVVGKSLDELPPCSVLLLPYCAKPLDCTLRHEDGCTRCGLCGIGDAYELADRHGMRPVTIINYEHLRDTLSACRRQGAQAFVGCCCEAFYAKHRDDFEAVGLPGVLVDLDSTSCYDLGEERLAYRGAFERQTRLRLDLLRKVLCAVSAKR